MRGFVFAALLAPCLFQSACVEVPDHAEVLAAVGRGKKCAAGFADCDGVKRNGCEAFLGETTHCGSCDVVCGPDADCKPADATYVCEASPPVSTDPIGFASANPSSVAAGQTTLLEVVVVPGSNPTSTGLTVSADLTAIGGSAAQSFTEGGGIFSFLATVGSDTPSGPEILPLTILDAEGRIGSAEIMLIVEPASTAPSAIGTADPVDVVVGSTTNLTVTVTPGSDPTSTGMTVTADLSSIGGSPVQPFADQGNGTFTYFAIVSGTPGTHLLPVTVFDAEGRVGTTAIVLSLLPAPTDPVGFGTAEPDAVDAGAATRLVVTVIPGDNPVSSGLMVTADLSSVGGSPVQVFGEEGNGTFSFVAIVADETPSGPMTLPVTVTDAQGRSSATSISLMIL